MCGARLYESIVSYIEAQILNGELAPGDQLPSERELTQQFGVSRTAVREAIKALREQGLVEVRLGRGTFVINKTSRAMQRSFNLLVKIGYADAFSDLTQIREILEPEIAALAALHATDEQISAMRRTIEALRDHTLNITLWAEADTDFHLILAEATQNKIIPVLLDSITGLVHDQRYRLLTLPGRGPMTQQEHGAILEAIEARDPDAAREAMRKHLQRVRNDVPLISSAPNDKQSHSDEEEHGSSVAPNQDIS